MATRGDDDTVVRMRPQSTLLVNKAPARQPVPEAEEEAGASSPALDDLIPLPGPGDPYKAHARPDNKALLTITFLCKDGAEKGFAYSDLRRIDLLPSGKPGGLPVLVLLFVEAVVTEVRVEARGGRLDTMRNYIRHHRIAWLRELPPGMMLADKSAAVITGFIISTVEG
jgi:hypothetical protein